MKEILIIIVKEVCDTSQVSQAYDQLVAVAKSDKRITRQYLDTRSWSGKWQQPTTISWRANIHAIYVLGDAVVLMFMNAHLFEKAENRSATTLSRGHSF
jgi:hypothetical protein